MGGSKSGWVRRVLHDNALSIVMLGLFVVFLLGQSVAGWREQAARQRLHGERVPSYGAYLVSGDFVEAVFENWESEFLQMGAFVLLAARLRQRGSGEAKAAEGDETDDDQPERDGRRDSPGPVHRGGLALRVYSHSLTLALFGLFVLSFALHALGGHSAYNDELAQHGRDGVSLVGYLGSARFWFESLQNWQSEFLSVGVLVVLSAFLRERGSPESKKVASPNRANE